MSRYIKDMELQLPEEEVLEVIQAFLDDGGFYKGQWQGKICYTTDYGFGYPGAAVKNLEQFYFFEYSYACGKLHFEAWLRDGKTKEMGLTGMYNIAAKQPYTALISKLEENLIAKMPEGSKERVQIESEHEMIRNDSRKMNTGNKIMQVASVIAFLIALLSVLMHLGFTF